MDLHLIGEGRHERLWEVLGARVMLHEDVQGTAFAVWAPNARGVRVIGDFNHWDGTAYPMRSLGGSGVWELFVPGLGEGDRYKFAILGADGVWRAKADPMARRTEMPARDRVGGRQVGVRLAGRGVDGRGAPAATRARSR